MYVAEINLGKVELTCHTFTDPQSILRPQYRSTFIPDNPVRGKIAGYFAHVIRKGPAEIKRHLPHCMPCWSKVRIAKSGDSISSTSVGVENSLASRRNSSYVRVCLQHHQKSAISNKIGISVLCHG